VTDEQELNSGVFEERGFSDSLNGESEGFPRLLFPAFQAWKTNSVFVLPPLKVNTVIELICGETTRSIYTNFVKTAHDSTYSSRCLGECLRSSFLVVLRNKYCLMLLAAVCHDPRTLMVYLEIFH
jgi:hypothetical protein